MINFLSPGALVIFPLAVLIDIIGIILIFCGLDDFGLTDIIAITFIGGWSAFKSMAEGSGSQQQTGTPDIKRKREAQKEIKKTMSQTAKTAKTAKGAKVAKGAKWLRWFTVIGELIPYFGVLPLWSIYVFFEIKNSK
jgi:hypothetical protein